MTIKMTDTPRPGLLRRLVLWIKNGIKANLIAGLLFLTPLVATFFFMTMLINWVDRVLLLIPPAWRPEQFLPFRIPGLGIILVVIVLLVTGFLVRNLLGRQLVALGERLLSHIPLVSKFYSAVKQLVETILSGATRDFKRVVLVEYPRKGVYTLAFVTGKTSGELQEKTHRKCINLFVPTTPNPTSGFYLVVPHDEPIPLDMSVEDAFRVLVSGGILSPDKKRAEYRGEADNAKQSGLETEATKEDA